MKTEFNKFLLSPSHSTWKKCLQAGFDPYTNNYESWKLFPYLQKILPEFEQSPSILQAIDDRCQRIQNFNNHSALHYREALQLLQDADIPYVLIKGAAMIASSLQTMNDRVLSDIDVLIHPENLDGALEALSHSHYWHPERSLSLRYRTLEREIHFDNNNCAVFDLHWQPYSAVYDTRIPDAYLCSTRTCSLWNLSVNIPAAELLFLNIFLHGSYSQQGILWILDSRLLIKHATLDWNIIISFIQEYQLRDYALSAIREAPNLFPDEVAREIRRQSPGVVERLESYVSKHTTQSVPTRIVASVATSLRYYRPTWLPLLPFTYCSFLYLHWECTSLLSFIITAYRKCTPGTRKPRE